MKKLNIKDVIMIGVYSALYFVFVGIGTLIGVVILHSGNMLLAPVFTALIAGVVYFLLINKVSKFGAITSVGIVMALFFFLSGHYILSFLPSLIFGLSADYIAKVGKYENKYFNLLSYIIFSYGNLGPIILMWFAKDQYIARLIEKGKDMTYINNVMVEFSFTNVSYLAIGIFISAFIGGLFGQYLIKKHFKKAGLVT